jgi:hypothetical protein
MLPGIAPSGLAGIAAAFPAQSDAQRHVAAEASEA